MLLGLILGSGGIVSAQDIYDDIYFNPDKESKPLPRQKQKKTKSNYIADFGDIDVDAYNRRDGFYYGSPIDTVGASTGNGEDFVYTQKIQKFYNPTIVVDNADLLEDVLENSYGNVDVIYNGLSPVFAPAYISYNPWPYSYYSYSGWYSPWFWGPSWSWSYPGWNWGWSWGWNYPGWGPSWGWGYPGWNWGWSPEYAHRWNERHYRPGGTGTVAARPGWSNSTRPVSNGSQSGLAHRRTQSGTYVPSASGTRGYNSNIHRTPGTGNGTHRYNGTPSYRYNGTTGTATPQYRPGNSGTSGGTHRYTGGSSTTKSYNTNRGSGTVRSSGSRSSSGSSYRSGSSSGGTHRSSGSSGSYRSSGGGSRGGGGHRR